MNTILLSLGTAAALGATTGVHCAAMCGPLAAVGTSRHGRLDSMLSMGYLGGRLVGYSLLGALAGTIAAPLTGGTSGEMVRLVLACGVAALLVYRAFRLVVPEKGEALVVLGRPSAMVAFFRTLVRFLPRRRGFGLGLATALFPCGALYAAVFAAASSGSASVGAAMMAGFAICSAPLLMLPALAATQMSHHFRNTWMRRMGALILVAAAAWVITPPLRSVLSPADKPACCKHGDRA